VRVGDFGSRDRTDATSTLYKAQASAFKRSHTQETVPLSISRSARVSTLFFLRDLFSKNHRALLLSDDTPVVPCAPRSFLPSVVTGRHLNMSEAD